MARSQLDIHYPAIGPTSRQRQHWLLLAILGPLIILLILFLVSASRVFQVQAGKIETLSISIRATGRADYSGDLQNTPIPSIREQILIDLIMDDVQVNPSVDRVLTLQADLLTPVPTMTPAPTFTPAPSATQDPDAIVNTVPPTPTPTVNTPTSTASPTPTPSVTATSTETATASLTPSPSATVTLTRTLTRTPTVTVAVGATYTKTRTPTMTVTSLSTLTKTPTSTKTSTLTSTATPSATPTKTATATVTQTKTATPTSTSTHTPTHTPTSTNTATNTATATATSTNTATNTPTSTPTPDVPIIKIADKALFEKNSGSTVFQFEISLSQVPTADISFDYRTVDGTATGGLSCTGSADYKIATGTISIVAPATTTTVNISICPDVTAESDETFAVEFSNPMNAVFENPSATGLIFDDDSPGFTSGDFVFSISPADGSLDVDVQAPVVIQFNRPMCEGSVTNPTNIRLFAASDVPSIRVYDPLNWTLTIVPDGPLEYSKTYTVMVRFTQTLRDGCIFKSGTRSESFTTVAAKLFDTFLSKINNMDLNQK